MQVVRVRNSDQQRTDTSLIYFYLFSFNVTTAWYDAELEHYQIERQETELEKVFEERHAQAEQRDVSAELIKKKDIKETEPEWTQSVKNKRGEEYYSKLREVSF